MFENLSKREIQEEFKNTIVKLSNIYKNSNNVWRGEELSDVCILEMKLKILINIKDTKGYKPRHEQAYLYRSLERLEARQTDIMDFINKPTIKKIK